MRGRSAWFGHPLPHQGELSLSAHCQLALQPVAAAYFWNVAPFQAIMKLPMITAFLAQGSPNALMSHGQMVVLIASSRSQCAYERQMDMLLLHALKGV